MHKKQLVTEMTLYQKQFWYEWLINPENVAHNTYFCFSIKGDLNISHLEEALSLFFQRHEAPRSYFTEFEQNLKQVILPKIVWQLEQKDISQLHDNELLKNAFINSIINHRFNLSTYPLFKCGLLHYKKSHYYCVLSVHHIISDAISGIALINEISNNYNQLCLGDKVILKQPDFSIVDYLNYEKQNYLSTDDAVNYWINLIKDSSLSIKFPLPLTEKLDEVRGEFINYEVKLPLAQKIKAACRKLKTSPFIIFSTIFSITLSKYSRLSNFALSYPVNMRAPGMRDLLGCFVNNIPLKVCITDSLCFADLILELTQQRKLSKKYQHLPFIELVAKLRNLDLIKDDAFFNVSIAESHLKSIPLNLAGLDVSSEELVRNTTNYDICFEYEQGTTFHTRLNYKNSLFTKKMAEEFIDNMFGFLNYFFDNPDSVINTSSFFLKDFKRRTLHNAIESEAFNFLEQYKKQVLLNPESLALIYKNECLNYRTLDNKVNQIANKLYNNAVEVGDVIAVYMNNHLDRIVCMLAIFKMHCIYLPLDNNLPRHRLINMINQANAKIIVEDGNGLNLDNSFYYKIENFSDDISYFDTKLNLNSKTGMAIFFTSGSTGEPKGILSTYDGVSNYLFSINEIYKLSSTDIGLQFASIGFDASLEEILLPLAFGSSLVLRDSQSIENLDLFIDHCNAHNITILTLPTSYWVALCVHMHAHPQQSLDSVRLINVSGEKLHVSHITTWFQMEHAHRIKLYNIYGTTETTIASTIYEVKSSQKYLNKTVPVGRPLNNTYVHILDDHKNPVPNGFLGELYIGGKGVSLGYINNQELTEKSFITNLPNNLSNECFYKTGDLAFYNDEEQIEIVGRADNQIKINDILISLDEISHALENHESVNQAVVIQEKLDSGPTLLIGYVTCKDNNCDSLELIRYLKEILPSIMIPSHIIIIDNFDFNQNYKIDMKKLKKPNLQKLGKDYVPPCNHEEKLIHNIWKEFLKYDVSCDLSFLELGGNSLLGIQITSRIEKLFNVKIPVRALLEGITIQQLSEQIKEKSIPTLINEYPLTEATPGTDGGYAASYSQKRLWYIDQLYEGTNAYNVIDAVKLEGSLNVDFLEKSLATIIEKNQIYRTYFSAPDGELRQYISEDVLFKLDIIDFTSIDSDAIDNEIIKTLDDFACSKFVLSHPSLIKFKLIQVSSDLYIFILVAHHIIIDGWSLNLLKNEIAKIYNNHVENNDTAPESHAAIQYKDYTEWHKNVLTREVTQGQLDTLKNRFNDTIPVMQIPTDFPRPSQQSFKGKIHRFKIDNHVINRLRNLSKKSNMSLFVILLSAYRILLHKLTQQNKICIGIPSLGRIHPELEKVHGFFVNTWVFLSTFLAETTVSSFISETRKHVFEALEYQNIPVELLMQELNIERDASYNPLFQTMFTYENINDTSFNLSQVKSNLLEYMPESAKFDFMLVIWEHGENIEAGFEYNTDLFNEETIGYFSRYFNNILLNILDKFDDKIQHIKLLNKPEIHDLILNYNTTKYSFECVNSFIDVFIEQARNKPNKIAAVDDSRSISYSDLDKETNQLASYLSLLNIVPEQRIVLFQSRNMQYLINMIAVLKLGAAFVPIDPSYPDDRIAVIIKNSDATIILTDAIYQASAKKFEHLANVICTDLSLYADQPNSSINRVKTLNQLAYVIYTSGSTGTPKGAMIEHLGMINHLYAKIYDLEMTENDIVAEIAVQTFDVSVWQFISALVIGAKVCIFEGDKAWQPDLLLSQISKERISIIQSVPSHTKVILDEIEFGRYSYDISSLKWYICNGELLSSALCARWFKLNPNIPIVNAYGATEMSDDTSHYKVFSSTQLKRPSVPINGALPNLTTYILDENLNPVPVGVIGEIYLAGVGVGRGYLNDPSKTKASFLPNPFSDDLRSRIYKSGDLAKLNSDLSIEILGRVDFQIKVRGLRIEIGEIEQVLLGHENISETLVVAYKNSNDDNFLAAYIVTKRHPGPSIQNLIDFCGLKLPQHMVPSYFILLDSFPLTNNGKVNRKALPLPIMQDSYENLDFIAPEGKIQNIIADIWHKVLQRDTISVHENFFTIGGHSLAAAESIIKLRTALNLNIPLKLLFENPTIAKLAEQLRTHESLYLTSDETQHTPGQALALIGKYPEKPFYPLAFCQIPEWFSFKLYPNSPVYNVSICGIFLHGKLNKEAFVEAWQIIIKRHFIFKARFSDEDFGPIQYFDRIVALDINDIYIDMRNISGDSINTVANNFAKKFGGNGFDLENELLFRLKLVEYADNTYQIIFVIHHIIWDEISTMNVLNELSTIYNQIIEHGVVNIPELKLSYIDYVQWINDTVDQNYFAKQQEYWLNIYKNSPAPLNLPTDYTRPPVVTYDGDSVDVWLPRDLSRDIRIFIQENNITLFVFMLAVLQLYLYRICDQEDFVIGCPIAGRDHDDFKPLLGLFATPMPIKANVNSKMSFNQLINDVLNSSLEAFENHYYPCTKIIEELESSKDLSRSKLFSVMYGVQNNKTTLLENLKFSNLNIELRDISESELNSARFDLTFVVDELADDIIFTCIYNTNLFKRSTIIRMVDNITHLTRCVLEDSNQHLGQYPIMTMREADNVLINFNNVTKSLPVDISYLELFINQVKKSPHENAIIVDKTIVTYFELYQIIKKTSHFLRKNGVKKNDRVAILMSPSLELIASIYAILLLGAAYIPLHIEYPYERINCILNDAEPSILLIDSNIHDNLLEKDLKTLNIIENWTYIQSLDNINLTNHVDSHDLAYIIYTSGTTGAPKGVEILHAGINNLIASTQEAYLLTPHDSLLQLTPISFDASVLDIFWPLAFGASIIIPSIHDRKDPQAIIDTIHQFSITLIQVVPTILDALCEYPCLPTSLRIVICGGAPLPRDLVNTFLEHNTCDLFNHYGPTEVTVDAARFNCREHFADSITPLGRPISNTHVYILDTNLMPLPIGSIGEICISSPQLSRGYRNNLSQTEKAFVHLNIHGVGSERIYRTGDLGKFSDDGILHYIGRIDKQIKHLGNRIELEEIDAVLARHDVINLSLTKYISQYDNQHGKIVSYIELKQHTNMITINDEKYFLFTLEQLPSLKNKMNSAHAEAWPAYFSGNKVSRQHWHNLLDFKAFQCGLFTEDGELAAVANSIPYYWDGDVATLPSGWDEALVHAIALNDNPLASPTANTLLVLAGITLPKFKSKGLSQSILQIFKLLAKFHHLSKIIVPVRPVLTNANITDAFESWALQRRDDGYFADPWLRTHERAGGQVLKLAPKSQRIIGTICEWQHWCNYTFTTAHTQAIPGTLQKASVDVKNNIVEYFDPSIWVEHNTTTDIVWSHITKQDLRSYLEQYLPAYMIPTHFKFIPKMPITEAGKINDSKLLDFSDEDSHEHIKPRTQMQIELVGIWKKIFGIDEIGITDDFFDLGGQSLKAINLLNSIHKKYGIKIPIQAFYSSPNIDGLCSIIALGLIDSPENNIFVSLT